EEERAQYDAALAAFAEDREAGYLYSLLINLTLVIITFGILLSDLILELIVPLLFGNGQTLGKKIFSLGLMRNDGVKLNAMQLFARTLLGKFTIETMIPVYVLIMLFWATANISNVALFCAAEIGE
ncbi:MAG: RDD family protein, partial [Alistipes sp.]|nr:RDD family protein [Alistipes sp.]